MLRIWAVLVILGTELASIHAGDLPTTGTPLEIPKVIITEGYLYCGFQLSDSYKKMELQRTQMKGNIPEVFSIPSLPFGDADSPHIPPAFPWAWSVSNCSINTIFPDLVSDNVGRINFEEHSLITSRLFMTRDNGKGSGLYPTCLQEATPLDFMRSCIFLIKKQSWTTMPLAKSIWYDCISVDTERNAIIARNWKPNGGNAREWTAFDPEVKQENFRYVWYYQELPRADTQESLRMLEKQGIKQLRAYP